MIKCSEYLCSKKLIGNLIESHDFSKITYTSPDYIGTGRVNIYKGDTIVYILKNGIIGSGTFEFWKISSRTNLLVVDGDNIHEDELIFIGKI